jgi:hypothetical protein
MAIWVKKFFALNFVPQHPAAHGGLRLFVTTFWKRLKKIYFHMGFLLMISTIILCTLLATSPTTSNKSSANKNISGNWNQKIFAFFLGFVSWSVMISVAYNKIFFKKAFLAKYVVEQVPESRYAEFSAKLYAMFWLDPVVVVGMLSILLVNIYVAYKIIRRQPLGSKLTFIIWFLLGAEFISCLTCFGFGFSSYGMELFSICPHLVYPRVGLIILVIINLYAIEAQRRGKNIKTAVLNLTLVTLALSVTAYIVKEVLVFFW